MNRPAFLVAAALAVALIPVTASAAASHPGPRLIGHENSDIAYTEPRFFVEQKKPPFVDEIVFAFKITETTRPDEYKLTMEMFKWLPTVYEADVYGRELKNIRDLPGAGSSAIWRMPRKCRNGRYYEELTTTGISSTGHYQRDEVFFPAGRRKVKAHNRLGWKWVEDDTRAPDRKHSHPVKAC